MPHNPTLLISYVFIKNHIVSLGAESSPEMRHFAVPQALSDDSSDAVLHGVCFRKRASGSITSPTLEKSHVALAGSPTSLHGGSTSVGAGQCLPPWHLNISQHLSIPERDHDTALSSVMPRSRSISGFIRFCLTYPYLRDFPYLPHRRC